MSPRIYSSGGGGAGGGGLSDAFKTIDTPAGTDPVASGAGTLILTSSNNSITITGNSGTDTVDFVTAGSAGFPPRLGISASLALGLTQLTIAITSSVATSIAITMPLAASMVTKSPCYVKDESGNASLYNIRLLPPGASSLIDGTTFFTLDIDYESVGFYSNGTDYFII